jgi:hypothetical protein
MNSAMGLGFQNFEDESSGKWQSNTPDIYSTFVFDNTTGLFWTQMSNPQAQDLGDQLRQRGVHRRECDTRSLAESSTTAPRSA